MFASINMRAQVGDLRNDFMVGVNGGYVISRVSFDPTVKKTWHGGPSFGVTLRYTSERYFSAICSLQGEINFARLGWTEVIETSTDTYSRDLNYIQMPFLARLAWGRELRGAQFFFQIGPQIAYYVGGGDHRGGEWSDATLALRPNQVTAQYDKEVERKFEYGLTGGLGLEISSRIGRFSLEGRYYYALSDIFHNGKSDPFGRSANYAIYIKAGYLFDLIRTKGVERK
ncbi:MAG: PorT family protein [Bacteroidaceae bacterium]|nr:PorT family protein [Bacteroidaceae bacterium]